MRPLALLLLAAPLWAQTPVTVRHSGPAANRVDMLILGDGYTAAELPKFAADVEYTVAAFFAQEPWKQYARYVNVHRVDVVSNESGASHPENNVTRDTALGAAYNCNGIQRLICINNQRVNAILAEIPAAQREIPLVLVNDTAYGGSGGAVAVASLHTQVVELVLHEIGHSFALLTDEYGGPPPPACNNAVEPTSVNAARDITRANIKWRLWIADDTPLPTDSAQNGIPGAYEGARYCDTGLYRPTFNSRMRSLGRPYEQINTEQFVKRYYNWVAPLESVSPAESTVVVSPSVSRTFSVSLPQLDTPTFSVKWILDSAEAGTGTAFHTPLSLGAGVHTLEAVVRDETPLVRNDPQSVLVERRTWRLLVQAECSTLVFSSGGTTVPAAGGSGSVAIQSGCNWEATAGASWVTISAGGAGSGNGEIHFQVQPNTASGPRNTFLAAGGRVFVIAQQGESCALSLTPPDAALPGPGVSGSVEIRSLTACPWTAFSAAPWITLGAAAGSGTGSLTYLVAANPTGAARSGAVAIGERIFTVTQEPLTLALAAVVNAASFAPGGVAPGEMVTLFGLDIGPAQITHLRLKSPGFLDDTLADVRVLFDGVPSPLVYVFRGQTSAIVPYSVAGRDTTVVQVEYAGLRSNTMTLPVRPSAPALFTANASGSGQAAALNQDLKPNNAQNPVARGSVLVLYVTGEGQTNPPGVDGRIATDSGIRPILPVTVLVGATPAEVLYAGSAPGLVAGVMQVNVRVPAGITAGPAVPVVVRIGEASSPAGVTVAVQ